MQSFSDVQKPWLRGHFHQAAFFLAIGACAMLIAISRDMTAVISAVVYSISQIALFGISAIYHRCNWGSHARAWMRRLDHSAIFISIAGTGTPISLLAVGGEAGQRLLVIFWSVAGLGILQSLFWVKAPKWLAALIYVGFGWLAIPYLAEISASIGNQGVFLLITGGFIYSIGALIYALKRPNPWPKTFGYHEIFHILVVIAAIFHFLMVVRLIR